MRLRRAEIISLGAALAVFVTVASLGLFVWRASSSEPATVDIAPTIAAPRPVAPQLEPAVGLASRPAFTPTVSLNVKTPEIAEAVLPDPLDLIPTWPSDRPFAVLMLGLDKRPGENSGRTDAMILTRVEPANNSAAMISIPRDLCVANCLTEPYRINTVLLREGPDALRQRIGSLMGLQVEYWIVLDFDGFRRLVDFFGGVDVDVSTTIYDSYYPNESDTGFDPLYVEAGLNRFDGDMALRYARSRHQDGTFARDKRQQQILLALRDQVLTPRTLVQSPAFLQQLSNTFQTNVPLEIFPSMAKLAFAVDSRRVVQGAVELARGMTYAVIAENGAYVLEPNVPLIQAYAANLIRQGESLPAQEKIEAAPELADRQHLEP